MHGYLAAPWLAISEDVTMVDRLCSFHESPECTSICTMNEACEANWAASDTMLKLLGITERERRLVFGLVAGCESVV